jgi:hypothetical protein
MQVKSAIYMVLGMCIILGQAQKCILLTGSTECPEFSTVDISLLEGASDTITFDSVFRQQFNSTLNAVNLQGTLDCKDLSKSNVLPRFRRTMMCLFYANPCLYEKGTEDNDKKPLCKDTCLKHTADLSTIISQRCPDSTKAKDVVETYKKTCESSKLYNGSQPRCVSGEENEPNSCGKQPFHLSPW